MNEQWRDFLLTQGAAMEDGRVAHFGDAAGELQAAAASGVVADLSQLGVLAVSGADAVKFLQGQLTNDVGTIDAARGGISGYCTPKGRLLAVFLMLRRGDELLLLADAALIAPLLQRLTKYRLLAKVELRDAGEAVARVGLSGDAAVEVVAEAAGRPPAADWDCVQADGLAVIRLPGPGPRFIAAGGIAPMQDLWRRAAGRLTPAGAPPWEWLDIRGGMPAIVPATQEEFIPQTVNLDALGGISFHKGCYTGQEIVARVHYLGRLKQRMFIARAAGAAARPGGRVYGGTAAGAQAAGTVVSAAADPGGGQALLVVLPAAAPRGGDLHLDGPGLGSALAIQTPPYPLPEPKEAPEG